VKPWNHRVYGWWCAATKKAYIGRTQFSALVRFEHHLVDASGALFTDLRALGAEAFSCFGEWQARTDREAAETERNLILVYNTMDPKGYNRLRGDIGKTVDEERLDRIRTTATRLYRETLLHCCEIAKRLKMDTSQLTNHLKASGIEVVRPEIRITTRQLTKAKELLRAEGHLIR